MPRVEVQGHLLDLTLSAAEHDGGCALEGVWTHAFAENAAQGPLVGHFSGEALAALDRA